MTIAKRSPSTGSSKLEIEARDLKEMYDHLDSLNGALHKKIRRAEAVVEAAREVIETVTLSSFTGPTLPHIDGRKMAVLREAIAAWDKEA